MDIRAGLLEYGGRRVDGRRIAAGLVDAVVCAGIFVIVQGVTGGGVQGGAMAVLWSLYYFVALEALNGQTLGKRLFRLRVFRTDGSLPGFREVLLRNVLRLVDALPVYLVGLVTMWRTGERRQRLGDIAAGTLVLDQNAEPERAAASPAGVTWVAEERASEASEEAALWEDASGAQGETVETVESVDAPAALASEQAAPVEEGPAFAAEEVAPAPDEPPATAEEADTSSDEGLAVAEGAPAVAGEEQAVAEKQARAVAEQAPASAEEQLGGAEQASAVEPDRPAATKGASEADRAEGSMAPSRDASAEGSTPADDSVTGDVATPDSAGGEVRVRQTQVVSSPIELLMGDWESGGSGGGDRDRAAGNGR